MVLQQLNKFHSFFKNVFKDMSGSPTEKFRQLHSWLCGLRMRLDEGVGGVWLVEALIVSLGIVSEVYKLTTNV